MRLSILFAILAICITAGATQYSAQATGNWSSSSTWSPSGVPGSGDTVTIGSGYTVTVTANAACAKLSMFNIAGALSANNTTLTINNGITLTVSGNLDQNVTVSNNVTGACNVLVYGSLSVSGNWTQNHTLSVLGNANNLTIGASGQSGSVAITGNLVMQNGFLTALGNANKVTLTNGSLDVDGNIQYSAGAINLFGTNEINANDNGSGDGTTKTIYLAGNLINTDKGSLTLSDSNSNSTFTVYFNGTATQYFRTENCTFKHIGVNNSGAELQLIDNPSNSAILGTLTIMGNGVLNTKAYHLDNLVRYAGQIIIASNGTLRVENANGVPTQKVGGSYVCVPDSNGTIEYYTTSTLTVFDEDFDFTKVRMAGSGDKSYSSNASRQIDNSTTKVQRLVVAQGRFITPTGKKLELSGLGSKTIEVDSAATWVIQDDLSVLDAYADFHFYSTVSYQKNGDQTVYAFFSSPTVSEPYGILDMARASGVGSVQRSVSTSAHVKVAHKLVLGDYAQLNLGQSAYLSLLSTASTTAYVSQMATTAGITYSGTPAGKFIVQKYIALPGKDYRDFTTPVKQVTLESWKNAGVLFTGFTGSNYPSFSFKNAYVYDEAYLGLMNEGFSPASVISSTIHAANGSSQITQSAWRIYCGQSGSTSFTLSDTGQIYTGNVDFLCTFNNGADRTADDGWNFLGNPYPSPINWRSIYQSAANTGAFGANGLQPTYYVYKPSDNGFSNDPVNSYGFYNAFTGVGVNLDSVIPANQGFWVKAYESAASSASEVLRIAETDKHQTSATVFHKSHQGSPVLAAITLKGNNSESVIWTHHWDHATVNYDQQIDIPKMGIPSGGLQLDFAYLGQPLNLWVNAAAFNSYNVKLPFYMKIQDAGTYQLEFGLVEELLTGANCIVLTDWETGYTTPVTNNFVYSFQSTAAYEGVRFTLEIKQSLEDAVVIEDAQCGGSADGRIQIDFSHYPENLSITLFKDGEMVDHITENPGVYSKDLWPGEYLLVDSMGLFTCDSYTKEFRISQPPVAEARFNAPAFATEDIPVVFINLSVNSAAYLWDFGDQSPLISLPNPTHTFSEPGTYLVTLKAFQLEGCPAASYTDTVVVKQAVGIAENDQVQVSISKQGDWLEVSSELPGSIDFDAYTPNGQWLGKSVVKDGKASLALNHYEGPILVIGQWNGQTFKRRIVFIKT
ncbi:MAG TPA: PKD domain-containing protein [Luteibaculaceae bacterium]|nr:PKD domain-containing protein [Luteibaculaceae bacterium]